MGDEISDTGTYHTHLYFVVKSPCRWSTVQKHFEGAHIETAKGTSQHNRDYFLKDGEKHKAKAHTRVPETFEEYGDMPIESKGARNDLADLQDMICQGYSNYEIISLCPHFSFSIEKIERIRQTIREEEYKNQFRQLEVIYIYGATGTGKTRSVMEKYGYENVFRVTDYDHPFDNYKGQDTVIFEEFRSSLKMQDMLNYLDGYPLELPCRYANKIACYTKVYIITNISLIEQYENIQKEHNEDWQAFKRRITKVIHYSADGQINESEPDDIINCFKTIYTEEIRLAFD